MANLVKSLKELGTKLSLISVLGATALTASGCISGRIYMWHPTSSGIKFYQEIPKKGQGILSGTFSESIPLQDRYRD